MVIEEIEQMLDGIEHLDSLSDEKLTELLVWAMIQQYGHLSVREFIHTVFKPFLLANSDMTRAYMDNFKDKYLEMLRVALKQRKKEIHIKRV